MSNFADPSKTFLPLDGDAFRAPENTALPADIFAATLTGWDAYGAIKAGFVAETTQENTKIKVFNKQGTYRLKLGQEETQLRFRPVDAKNKAVALTNLRGGSVSAAAGGYEHIRGTEEEFALIIRVQDGTEWIAYYAKRAALESVPGETLDGEDIVGYDYILNPLVPDDGSVACRKFTKTNWIA